MSRQTTKSCLRHPDQKVLGGRPCEDTFYWSTDILETPDEHPVETLQYETGESQKKDSVNVNTNRSFVLWVISCEVESKGLTKSPLQAVPTEFLSNRRV